ncbi:MAG: DUF6900 domain-containing protein [Saccharofermentanales bacterium]|jgi:hypothetical protein|uniref:DUF6900 domain-containing protein n=1 Tax=Anaerosphaera multitolerans TaxID=2487351 RepID=UPI0013E32EEB|nr:hypothetical protein [Anaerosphaera multitolerans]
MKKDLEKKLEAIVKERYPDIETLESRNSDSLDFHEISVWGLRELLEKAYELGRSEAGR